MKELDIPSGRHKLSSRKWVNGKPRQEVISYAKGLLIKYNLPTIPELY